jgi:uncharacterized membrane protein YsdA (DUF1294 family)
MGLNASRQEGTLASWNDARGFGYILPLSGGDRVFAHIHAWPREAARPKLGDVVTFFAYAHDKAAARAGRWRTKESTLHVLSLVGGWPGALLVQRLLHHKNRKTSFQAVFWVTVAANAGAFLLVSSPQFTAAFARIVESLAATRA